MKHGFKAFGEHFQRKQINIMFPFTLCNTNSAPANAHSDRCVQLLSNDNDYVNNNYAEETTLTPRRITLDFTVSE